MVSLFDIFSLFTKLNSCCFNISIPVFSFAEISITSFRSFSFKGFISILLIIVSSFLPYFILASFIFFFYSPCFPYCSGEGQQPQPDEGQRQAETVQAPDRGGEAPGGEGGQGDQEESFGVRPDEEGDGGV